MTLEILPFNISLLAEGSGIGAIGGIVPFVGIGFLLVFAVVAFIAFKMLKKTVKMAVRMAVVAAILLIALVGTVALFMFAGGSSSTPVRTAPTRSPR